MSTPQILGFFSTFIIYAYITLLSLVLPGRWIIGYVNKEGSTEKLKYRLNGLLVFIVTVATWVALCHFKILAWDFLYQVRWAALAGSIVFGLVASFMFFIAYPKVKDSAFADFFLGRKLNWQLWDGRIDAKMWLYLVGAIMLGLNLYSFGAHHYLVYETESNWGIFLSIGLFTFFISDYFTFEAINLYTYDIFAERVGFKLVWGCIAFYPFFYSIPLWSTVALENTQTPTWLMVLAAVVFFGSWSLSRGANMQKYFFKKDPKKKFLGITPESITDGKKTLLVNGYWGLSRHINYLGEIGMGIGIVLALGHLGVFWPWLYPLYYVALLFPRQADDDKRCEAKYGDLWKEYVKKVPRKIIPFIY